MKSILPYRNLPFGTFDAILNAMNGLIRRTGLLAVLMFANGTYSQTDIPEIRLHLPDVRAGSVGFQLLEFEDDSRTVTSTVSPRRAYPRPIRVYLWYPAASSEDKQVMRFGRYVELADDDIWPAEIVGDLHDKLTFSRRALARSLGTERFGVLLRQPVVAIEDAIPSDGTFPLIVIGQGVYYESPIVFSAMAEFLAGRGFVVATSPLSGTNSPIVTVDVKGLETQVRDLEFAIAQARTLPFVSQDMLGVFGFDMGGMAGLLLTMRNADVDAFASVSSGILYPHPVGIPAASPDYDPVALRSPWFHSVPSSWMRPKSTASDESLFSTATQSDRYLLLTEGMDHVDYTGFALIEGRPAMPEYWEAAEFGDVARYTAVGGYIAEFFSAYLKVDSKSTTSSSRHKLNSVPDKNMTLEYRPAAPSLITYEEFIQAVISGRARDAVDQLRNIKESQPDHILFDEDHLNRIIYSLRGTWGFNEEILPVLEFMVELNPESANALYMLAECQIVLANFDAAIESYNGLLKLDPDDKEDYIRRRLKWLHLQQ